MTVYSNMNGKSLQGKMIQLLVSHDGIPIPPKKIGVVVGEDREGNLLVKWENNQSLSFLSKKSQIKITNEI